MPGGAIGGREGGRAGGAGGGPAQTSRGGAPSGGSGTISFKGVPRYTRKEDRGNPRKLKDVREGFGGLFPGLNPRRQGPTGAPYFRLSNRDIRRAFNYYGIPLGPYAGKTGKLLQAQNWQKQQINIRAGRMVKTPGFSVPINIDIALKNQRRLLGDI